MNDAPTYEFLGHAAFVIEASDGTSLVVDPYPPNALGGALGLPAIDRRFDFGSSSHPHSDHDGIEDLPGPPVRAVAGRFGPFRIERAESFHDEYGGRRRGGAVDLLVIEVDGRTVVHASDIGCSPSAATIEAIAGCDLLLVPVGGFYTIGAAQAWEWILRCSPKTIVPMHFASPDGTLPIRSVEPFLHVATWPRKDAHGPREIGRSDDLGQIVVLERFADSRI